MVVTKNLIKQVFLFGIVGLLTLAVDVTVTTVLYNFAHLPAYLASGIGFLSGFFVNFPLNRGKVFQHSKDDRFSLHTQVVLYVALSVTNLFLTSLSTDLLVNSGLLQISYAKVVVTAVFAVWNFIVFKFLIFSKKKSLSQSRFDERVLNDII